TGAIDDLHRAVSTCKDEEKIADGKAIVERLTKLKYELQHNRPLTPLLDDGRQDVADYNRELDALASPTWFDVPWLYAECYLYRYKDSPNSSNEADYKKIDASAASLPFQPTGNHMMSSHGRSSPPLYPLDPPS
ncbi:MAG: hypothetical protein Q9180_008005, partial [Flavoplaca navasiana]